MGSFFFHLIQNGSIPQVALELVTQINNPFICQLFFIVAKFEMSKTIDMQIWYGKTLVIWTLFGNVYLIAFVKIDE